MAIRRRANGVLALSAIVLAAANIYLFLTSDDQIIPAISESVPYDYINPPPCAKPAEEAIRLNELIANAWYKCKRTKRIPDEPFGFHVCVDEAVGIQHVFSGERLTFVTISGSRDDYRLEKTLLKISGKHEAVAGLVISDRPTFPVSLRQYTQHILYSTISVNEKVSLSSLATDLTNRVTLFARERGDGEIDIMKLDCIDCWTPDHLAGLIDHMRILDVFRIVRQLHLIVKLDEMDQSLFYLWYRVLSNLFFTNGDYFALYAAQQLGDCGRKVANCQYQLAFGRINAAAADGVSVPVLAPVAGMGSPDEEYNRLIWFLERHVNSSICSSRKRIQTDGGPLDSDWTICDSFDQQKDTGRPCLVYYFNIGVSQRLIDGAWREMFPSHCSLHLFDPTAPYDQQYDGDGMNLYSVTLASENSGKTQPGFERNTIWRLSTLTALLNKTNPDQQVISLMIVDLQGGEWDVFEQILSAASVLAFSQLAMRIRIWQGEENENYRQFYSWFYRLEKAGFQTFALRPLEATGDTRVMQNCTRMVPECSRERCYEIGWIVPGL